MSRFSISVFLLLVLLCVSISGARAQGEYADLLSQYRRQFLPEKIFVHTDKDIYAGGETVWMAVYLTDGQTHRPDSLSKLIHVELRNNDGKTIDRLKLYPFDGHSAGDFSLPATVEPGTYQLVAYTNFQRNGAPESLFRKSIRVLGGLEESGGQPTVSPRSGNATASSGGRPGLRFFPEGGDCVNGIPCRVAVYATAADGSPVATEGYLAGPDNQARTFFKVADNGVGSLTYVPKVDEEVKVVIDSELSFPLPPALTEGYHLKVYHFKDTFRVQLASNLREGLAGSTLVIHLRGAPLLERTISTKDKGATFRVPRTQIPPGVAVATLFDPWGAPVAERLFFVPPPSDDVELSVRTDRPTYGTREAVELNLGFPNGGLTMDSTLSGRMSVSVIPSRVASASNGDDIRSWLLLNSDLNRLVPNAPEVIFEADERLRDQRMEDLLLTRGWRRFRWEALREAGQGLPEFLMEDGVYVQGRMTKYDYPDAGRPGKVFLTRLENGFLDEVMTDEEGYFTFGPYRTFDTLEVDIQGRFRPGRRNRLNPKITLEDNPAVRLSIFDPPGPEMPTPDPLGPLIEENTEILEEYQELSRQTLTVARNFDSLIIDLDVVDITAKRIDAVKEERKQRTTYYTEPDSRIEVDSIGWAGNVSSVLSLLRTVPGVVVTGNQGSEQVRIRGNTSITLSNDPAFFIDGALANLDAVRSLPIQVVEFIDVLRGARANVLGVNGGNGAILVFTRRGSAGGNVLEPGLLRTALNGYHKAREFATFDADDPANRNRPDLRTTLHWNPTVRSDWFGNAVERFFASDQTGAFTVIVQGLRNDGRPYFGTTSFRVSQ